MVRGSPRAAGLAACWNQPAKHSTAIGIGVGRMASSLDPIRDSDANDLAIQYVATTLLVQVDLSKSLTLDCSGNCRDSRLRARQLGARTLGARTIAVVATRKFLPGCDYLAALRSARSESSR